jgi:hypothetical protein
MVTYSYKNTYGPMIFGLGVGYDVVCDGSTLKFWVSDIHNIVIPVAPGQTPLDTNETPIQLFSYKLPNGAMITFSKDGDMQNEES